MFSQRFRARRSRGHSLTQLYKPISKQIDGKGRHNDGVLVVKRVSDGLKCVEKRFKTMDIVQGRAEFEILILKALTHPNIVKFLDAYIDLRGPRPRASLFMGYADLGNLEDFYSSRRVTRKQPFRETAMWDLFAQLIDAVAYLQFGIRKATSKYDHERLKQHNWIGVVHRDMLVPL